MACRILCLLLLFLGGALPAATPTRSFDIPAGDAEKMLQRFAVQSGVEVLFSTEAAKGVRTWLHATPVRLATDRK